MIGDSASKPMHAGSAPASPAVPTENVQWRVAKRSSQFVVGLREVERSIGFGVVLLVLVACWGLLARIVADPLKLPSPVSVLAAAGSVGGDLTRHAAATWGRVAAGLVIGSALGVFAAFAMRLSRPFALGGVPLLELLRPVPPVALVPFLLLWFGVSFLGQVSLVVYGVTMTMAIGAYGAIGNVNPAFVRVALSLGASRRRLVEAVLWPALLPELVSAVRIAAGLAFTLAVVAEFMGAESGLGFLIMQSRRVLKTETIVLSVVVIGVEAWATDTLIRRVAARRLAWFRGADFALE